MAFLTTSAERHRSRSATRRPLPVLEFSLDEVTGLKKREGALYPSAEEWELLDLFRAIPERSRREAIEILRLTERVANGKKID